MTHRRSIGKLGAATIQCASLASLALGIVCLVCPTSAAQPNGAVNEHFTWTEPGTIASSDGQEVARSSSDSGLQWRGHAAAGVIAASDDGMLSLLDGANTQGSYVFTNFDSRDPAVDSADLTRFGSTIKLFVERKATGQQFRWLIRDAEDSWYISSVTDNPIPENAHKGFPPQVYRWQELAAPSADYLNGAGEASSTELNFGAEQEPDLSNVTGVGIYVVQGGSDLIVDWLQLHEYEPLVTYCPEYSTHYIETASGVRWGFSALGGGSSAELYVGESANLNSPGWGRAFLSAFRSKWHSGTYNPTQGGRTASHGATTPMEYVDSDEGTRIEYGPFQVATMGRHFDMLTFHDLTNGRIPGGYDETPGLDMDGIDEDGFSEADEVLTEFWMEGFYEDVSHLFSDGDVAAIRIYQQYDYRDEPHAILQYGEEAVMKDGQPVLDDSFKKDDISPLLDGDQPSTAVDPSHLLFFWGDRIDRNDAAYNWFWWRDDDGEWVSRPLDEEKRWQRPPNDGPRFTLLVESPDDPDAPAIGLYYPDWSRYNAYNVAGVQTETGQVVYEEDRNAVLRWRAAWRATGNQRTLEGCTFTSRFNKRDFGLILDGVLAPGNGLAGVHERIRFEAFQMVGTPRSIAKSIEELERHFCSTNSSCITTSREGETPRAVEVDVYPNPAADWLRIGYPTGPARLTITDLLGRTVQERQLDGSGQALVDASKLSAGVYFVSLELDGERLHRQVIVAR